MLVQTFLAQPTVEGLEYQPMRSGATMQFLSEYLDHAGTFSLTPDKMVFKEAKSKLVDAGSKEIIKW